MAVKSLQQTVDRWKASTASGQPAYEQGVANCDIDVTGRAIAALPQAQANYAAAISSGLTARRLQASGNQGWKNGVARKGGANWTNGVTNGGDKFAAKMGKVLQFETSLQSQIQNMPSNSPGARDQRMLAWVNGMRQGKANGAFD
jgi:hypothetical protein